MRAKDKLTTIQIGHTPDMDDAFMFYGIASGAVPMDGLRFEHVVEDIQTLNRRALRAELDVTAISAASYPALSKDYWIMSVGSSIGQGYGPLVISKTPHSPQELEGRRIAVPGLHTTAYMLLRLAVPQFVPVEMPFSQIPEAVLRGDMEAGLVIHEWQLIYRDAGLLPVLDLGLWWQQQTKLPVPLGLNVVSKSLGRKAAQQVTTVLRDSILYAFAHQEWMMRTVSGPLVSAALRLIAAGAIDLDALATGRAHAEPPWILDRQGSLTAAAVEFA